MAELRPVPAALFEELLETLRDSGGVSELRTRLRAAVVLSSTFTPDDLAERFGPSLSDAELNRFLADDCAQVRGQRAGRWRLRAAVRRETLSALSHRELLQLAPLDGRDRAGAICRDYIAGTAPELSRQTVDELTASLTAVEWLVGTTVPRPSTAAVQSRLDITRMVEPLRILVADGFFGRQRELARVRDYLDARASVPLRPFVLLGPGGVGKSTLVARLLLAEVDGPAGAAGGTPTPRPRSGRLLAYLSFDRFDLSAAEPLTLLRAALQQIAAQRADAAADALALADVARDVVERNRRRAGKHRASRASSAAMLAYSQGDEYALLKRFAMLVGELARGDGTAPIWVLDTFEVAQRESAESLDGLWDFLQRLSEACGGVHLLVTGRAPVGGPAQESLVLGDLDSDAADAFLRTQLDGLNLPDDFVAAVHRAVRPYPLTLRLAVLRIRGIADELRDSRADQRELLEQLRTEPVQGVLYRRILDHVADPDVRMLARRGLLVRRITPSVIGGFLAAECGLGPIDEARAEQLYDALQREVGLVQVDGQGGLVQRPEFRSLYLQLVERDDPEANARLRQAAVEFYLRPATADKVEELYYRLSLGQPTVVLDAAFDRSAAERLAGSADEFPASSRAYLAGRLGHSVAQWVLDEADDVSWARQVRSSARRLLDAGRAEEALELLQERSSDTVIPWVAALRVEAIAVVSGRPAALDEALRYLDWARDRGEDEELATELALIAARLAEDLRDFDRSRWLLREVADRAERRGDPLTLATAEVGQLRTYRRQGELNTSEADRLRSALIEIVTRLGTRVGSDPALVLQLAAEIGEQLPWLYEASLQLSGHAGPAQAADASGAADAEEDDDALLTSSEYADELREQLAHDGDGELHRSIAQELQSESDESAF